MSRLACLTLALSVSVACGGPSYQRGTDDPSLDEAAMSTGLDRADLEHAMDKWLAAFNASGFVSHLPSGPRTISVLDISNETS